MNPIIRLIFLFYFAVHIPISILIDAQAVLPSQWYPEALRSLVNDWYWENFHDVLMKTTPVWFQSLVVVEMLIQLPFFVYAVLALAYRWNSFRIPALAYGVHLLTVMIPIIAEIACSTEIPNEFKTRLFSIYGPWVCIPSWLLAYMAFHRHPFPREVDSKRKTKVK